MNKEINPNDITSDDLSIEENEALDQITAFLSENYNEDLNWTKIGQVLINVGYED